MDFFQFTFPISGVETFILIPPLVAFGISFFTSMGGISGAFLLLPFQMSVLGFTTPSVTATNFLFNVTGTPGGVYRYTRECRFVWPVAMLIVTGIIPGVLICYFLRITYLPDPIIFKFFVGCVLLLIALKLLKEAFTGAASTTVKNCSLTDRVQAASIEMKTTHFDFKGATYSFATAKLLGLALAVGIIGGVYGIGGGSIIAPFLVTFFGLPVYAIAGAVLLGIDAHLIEVEADLGAGLPRLKAVGLPDAAVREGIDRIRSAIKHARMELPDGRVTINLAPAEVRK